jgi:hypothetical protein
MTKRKNLNPDEVHSMRVEMPADLWLWLCAEADKHTGRNVTKYVNNLLSDMRSGALMQRHVFDERIRNEDAPPSEMSGLSASFSASCAAYSFL